jgi:hypothetical protein
METPTKMPQAARATDRVVEALSTLAALLDRSINEVKTLDSDFQNRLLQAVHDTEASLQRQAAQHLEAALAEDRRKLEEQFNAKTGELMARFEAERNRLNAEIKRLNAEKATAGPALMSETLAKEVERVEGLIKQISALMEDSSTDLSTVIRKNVEKSELESYLRGIRFALHGK